MKHPPHEHYLEHNRQVLVGLQDALRLLSESNAVIGRDEKRIVLDMSKVPDILSGELEHIFRTATLIAPNAGASMFSAIQTDANTQCILLQISGFMETDRDFARMIPLVPEIRTLLESIPVMSPELSEVYEALDKRLWENFHELFAREGTSFMAALFSAFSADADEEEDDSSRRTIN